MIVWSVAVSGIVYEESARAARSCQFRTTWLQQLRDCDVTCGGKRSGNKMRNGRV
jgi:hypothetical protein